MPTSTDTPEPFEAALLEINGVNHIIQITVWEPRGEDVLYIVSIQACVNASSNTQTVAEKAQRLAFQFTASAFVDFSIILDDGRMTKSYYFDNRNDIWRITSLSAHDPSCGG
jgi:hypothetical protein